MTRAGGYPQNNVQKASQKQWTESFLCRMEADTGLSGVDCSICAGKAPPNANIHPRPPSPTSPLSLETDLQSLSWSSLIVHTQFPTFSKHGDVTLKVAEIISTTATWMRQRTRDDLGTHTPFMGCTGASPDLDGKPAGQLSTSALLTLRRHRCSSSQSGHLEGPRNPARQPHNSLTVATSL